ncbi:class I glutamine amidotransferase-like protein [Neohortaea acidophila]|uniref:Class I glutamine amidotransferase-like protein n=1 Tax=Neohortaea acidophila TaxID=245834 RepID=A0A6A6Q6Q7_9PEZI|nr:class I glutamine amidotransferase-like protein [Neohortaea acidophila]KAF2487719.1 class I glutamine amidotransferase-like protein [Neohortaea acidophila]
MEQETGLFPPPLCKGDTIAVISPAFRPNALLPDHLARGQQFLIDQGYQVRIIYTPIDDLDFGAQVQQRCDEIHEAFRDPAVTAIICTVGGAESHELLPMLDYPLIRSNPKIFVGFSDITSLHCGIFTQTGLRTFYGPMVIDPFGGSGTPNSFTIKAFFDVVTASGQQAGGPLPIAAECDVVTGVFDDPPESDVASTMKPNPG